jgi:hypothetical protein
VNGVAIIDKKTAQTDKDGHRWSVSTHRESRLSTMDHAVQLAR